VISELFEFWMAKPENLPSGYRDKSKHDPLPRVVCDYIAGMTDNYIYEQYQRYRGGAKPWQSLA
jgi:dGTPase